MERSLLNVGNHTCMIYPQGVLCQSMSKKYLKYAKSNWFIAIACLVIGAATILGIRFFTYKADDVHYHANFALYINGTKEDFNVPLYYTEVAMCTLNTTMTPLERAHMHDNVNNVVHVEDHAVTWGQFFTNLGWQMGPNFIVKSDGTMYTENGDSKLHLLINGQDYTNLGGMQNTVIKDQDKLLVSFGDQTKDQLQKQYNAVPSTAQHYDVIKDPKSCSGHGKSTMHDRLVHMF